MYIVPTYEIGIYLSAGWHALQYALGTGHLLPLQAAGACSPCSHAAVQACRQAVEACSGGMQAGMLDQ